MDARGSCVALRVGEVEREFLSCACGREFQRHGISRVFVEVPPVGVFEFQGVLAVQSGARRESVVLVVQRVSGCGVGAPERAAAQVRGDRAVGVGLDFGVVPVPLHERFAVGGSLRCGESDLLLFEHADRITADVSLVRIAVAGLQVVDDDAAQRAFAFGHAASVAPPRGLVVDQHRDRIAVLVVERAGYAAGVVRRSEIAFVDVRVAAVGQSELDLFERNVGIDILVGKLADRLLLADEVARRAGRLPDDVGGRKSAERIAFGIGLLGEGQAVERDLHGRIACQRVVRRRVELQAVAVAAVEHLYVSRLGVYRVVGGVGRRVGGGFHVGVVLVADHDALEEGSGVVDRHLSAFALNQRAVVGFVGLLYDERFGRDEISQRFVGKRETDGSAARTSRIVLLHVE